MKPFYRVLRDAIFITLGCLLMALAVDIFLDPNNVVPGGFTAIAIFANRLRGWPTGLTLLALNIPFLALSVWLLGAEFGPKTIAAAVLVSLAIDFLQPYLPTVQGEPLLYVAYGGLLFGAGQALVFRAGATSGGTEPVSYTHLLTLVLFALVLPAASAAPVVPPHSEGFTDPVVIRVYYDDPAQIAQLADFDVFEFNNKTEKYVLVAVDSADYTAIQQLGFRVQIDEVETAAFNRKPEVSPDQVNGIPGYPCYRTVEELSLIHI